MSESKAHSSSFENENNLASWHYRERFKRARRTVIPIYWKARFLGWLRRTWSNLTGSDHRLLHLDKLNAKASVSSWRYVGIQNVLINQIIGCESPCAEFDRAFYPTPSHDKSRWLHAAIAKRLGRSEPPIELIHTPRGYFVQTGEYQISVARASGESTMPAYVTSLALRDDEAHWTPDKEEIASRTRISNDILKDTQESLHPLKLYTSRTLFFRPHSRFISFQRLPAGTSAEHSVRWGGTNFQ
jgi:hypothetical protein